MKFPLAVVAAAFLLMLVGFASPDHPYEIPALYTNLIPGGVDIPDRVDGTSTSRKLQDSFDHHPETKSNAGNIDLQDYRSVDPSPSSKATIKAGPIEHGSPLLPYIPQPMPPAPGPPGPPEQG